MDDLKSAFRDLEKQINQLPTTQFYVTTIVGGAAITMVVIIWALVLI